MLTLATCDCSMFYVQRRAGTVGPLVTTGPSVARAASTSEDVLDRLFEGVDETPAQSSAQRSRKLAEDAKVVAEPEPDASASEAEVEARPTRGRARPVQKKKPGEWWGATPTSSSCVVRGAHSRCVRPAEAKKPSEFTKRLLSSLDLMERPDGGEEKEQDSGVGSDDDDSDFQRAAPAKVRVSESVVERDSGDACLRCVRLCV